MANKKGDLSDFIERRLDKIAESKGSKGKVKKRRMPRTPLEAYNRLYDRLEEAGVFDTPYVDNDTYISET